MRNYCNGVSKNRCAMLHYTPGAQHAEVQWHEDLADLSLTGIKEAIITEAF